ncbi:hypothetical protein L596_009472 [Steinernema carpocapsae]|uniref:LRRNT domain-containing protein n=1 Tax=Steinernema carpocapsae TaxID=34508 RepID=A0A4U5PFZ2_STECR|nr:hypothetical protein L596_009472 [Steinernema carpocapsae]
MCPGSSDELLSVRCDGAAHRSIPILLNPAIRSLSLAGNQISKLNVDHLRLYSSKSLFYASFVSIFVPLSSLISSSWTSPATASPRSPRRSSRRSRSSRVLRLGANNVTALERDAFVGLYQLQNLDLGGNKIERVAVNTFADLNRLYVLNLSSNSLHLHLLSPAAFAGLKLVSELDLSGNKLDSLPSSPNSPPSGSSI